jgi:hypothetical protein
MTTDVIKYAQTRITFVASGIVINSYGENAPFYVL